jgi:RecJ-like exonuclease
VRGKCDKCGGEGETWHECASCAQSGRSDDCPSCKGELRYRDECPACEGTGYITDAKRDGVSVFPEEEGLYRYMVERDAELEDCVVIELEGEPSDDEDFDADEGALLVKPTRICDVRGIDQEMVSMIRRQRG